MKMDWNEIKKQFIEFIIVYGWAIMVILAGLSALVYFGVI